MKKTDLKKKQKKDSKKDAGPKKPQANIFGLLKPYMTWVTLLVVLSFLTNGLGLWVPAIIAAGIDSYGVGTLNMNNLLVEFLLVVLGIFIFTYIQSIIQTYASEKVALDLREKLAGKISQQSYLYIQEVTPAKLLTNLTSDIDAIKMFVSMAIVSLSSSVILIVGATILLLSINWVLALAVLTILPIIGVAFFTIFAKVRNLFIKSQGIIDWLNKVINESIWGAALIRVVNAQKDEQDKFVKANTEAKNNGLEILKLFTALIPIITLAASCASLVIVVLGGYFVIGGSMTLGDFSAFNSYLGLLIFPIMMLGFMSNLMVRASSSYQRIAEVLDKPEEAEIDGIKSELQGDVKVSNVSLNFGEKKALKDVSFKVEGGTKTAIIGPTAAGKTQLLFLLTGLTKPAEGTVEYDGHLIDAYDKESLHRQIGIVFQDSIIFNLSLRENIAFNSKVRPEDLQRAIDTAEIGEFIGNLPDGLETIVSERGTSLSGGQKQRVMLARALALNPKVLLLDDFTARVDNKTEAKILSNVEKNYPGITLISITQKIGSVQDYDQIILLMEGEILAKGTHQELMESSPEYVQIFNSQRSTNHYELHS
ncbi:MAG: ABC transporter ATP-binding protein [Candidatus Altimarinota bacterium]